MTATSAKQQRDGVRLARHDRGSGIQAASPRSALVHNVDSDYRCAEGARRQDGWGMRVEFQVFQEADDDTLLRDESDQASPLATHATTHNI